jgi:hypothetical protein
MDRLSILTSFASGVHILSVKIPGQRLEGAEGQRVRGPERAKGEIENNK